MTQVNTMCDKQFAELKSKQELEALRLSIENAGYSGFRPLVEEMEQHLKSFEESDAEQFLGLLANARTLFPNPGQFSPAWDRIWDRYKQIAGHKMKIYRTIPRHEREGEWQVLLDNPYSNDGIVVYPGLSFKESVYLYAYFLIDLKKNEYIRLQKVTDLVMQYGEEE